MPITIQPEVAASLAPESRTEAAVPPWSRVDSIAILAITAFGTGLRLYHLGTRSLWFDEGFSAGIALMRWPDFLRVNSGLTANMALYYLLLKFWMPLGHTDAWTRGLSVLFGIAAIPAMYWLARKMFNSPAAIAAALLLASNAFHVKYSQEARAYSLVALLCIVSCILLLRATEKTTTRAWLAWSLVSALAVIAHTYAVLVVGAEVVWAFLVLPARERWRLFAAVRWFVLALVPYAVAMTRGGTGAIGWLQPFTLRRFGETMVQICGNAGWTLPVLLAAGCAGVFWMRREERRGFALAAMWAILPFAAVIAMSPIHSLLYPRYMIVCVPGIVLMAAVAAARLPRVLTVLWLLAAVSVSLWATVQYYEHDFLPHDDWRATSAYVRSHAAPSDLLLFYTWQGTLAYHYYLWQADRSAPRPDPNYLRYSNIAELLQDQPADAQRVWVVFDHFGGSDPNEIWIRGWFSQHYTIRSEQDFRGMTVLEYRHK